MMKFSIKENIIFNGDIPLKHPSIIVDKQTNIVYKIGDNDTLMKFLSIRTKSSPQLLPRLILIDFSSAIESNFLSITNVKVLFNAISSAVKVEELVLSILHEKTDSLKRYLLQLENAGF